MGILVLVVSLGLRDVFRVIQVIKVIMVIRVIRVIRVIWVIRVIRVIRVIETDAWGGEPCPCCQRWSKKGY